MIVVQNCATSFNFFLPKSKLANINKDVEYKKCRQRIESTRKQQWFVRIKWNTKKYAHWRIKLWVYERKKNKSICLRDIRYLFVFCFVDFFFFFFLSTLFLLHIEITFDCDYVKTTCSHNQTHAKKKYILRWTEKKMPKRARYSKTERCFCLLALLHSRIYSRHKYINEMERYRLVDATRDIHNSSQRAIYTRLLRSLVDCDVFSFTLSVGT